VKAPEFCRCRGTLLSCRKGVNNNLCTWSSYYFSPCGPSFLFDKSNSRCSVRIAQVTERHKGTGLNRRRRMQKRTKSSIGRREVVADRLHVSLFIAFFFSASFGGPGNPDTGTGTGMPAATPVAFALHVLTMLFILGVNGLLHRRYFFATIG
jgi:hypothetical protein